MTNVVWQEASINKMDRQKLNGNRSFVLWFTGLSGSGKSTLANALDTFLYNRDLRTYLLDGDNIRLGLNKDLGFDQKDRLENIRRIAEVSRLFVDAGVICIDAFISPYAEDRERVRATFEAGEFIEIYVKCPIEVCEIRDPKGLYKKARADIIKNFTGISSPYEEPKQPEIVIESDQCTVQQSVQQIIQYLINKGLIAEMRRNIRLP